MLQLRNVSKSYTTADFTQVALDDVSISFRDNEFVAILGPSGSGKTTLLNIIGGLDHYDSGNLIIDGIATEDYKDRDWDAYRNNRIGFVFQSYNLIPHQSVLSNVELALTLSGVSRGERKRRATLALERVGLGDHIHKRPNQLSGGQMQRVAIARALINDPEILLADEPTGALDSKTSEQVMALLTEIANDRLVIMVTHNPELAEKYATRTVDLRDGQIEHDSDPFVPDSEEMGVSNKAVRWTSMSLPTAIALSFNNLMTKKGRTLMTAFAGSIGIIGIAAILALANGVNQYIKGVEEDTLSVYPLTIQSQGMDITSLVAASADISEEVEAASKGDGDVHEMRALSRVFESVGSNDLASLKAYLDDNGGGINEYVNLIHYTYNVTPQLYAADTTDGVRQVNPDNTFAAFGFGATSSSPLVASSMSSMFNELMEDTSIIEEQYDMVSGHWPKEYDEAVVVLTPNGGISDYMSYTMGLRDPAELDAMVDQLLNDETIVTPSDSRSFSYEDLTSVSFKLVYATDYYVHDEQYDVWTDKSGDKEYLKELVEAGEDIRVVGVIAPKDGATATALQPGIYYSPALTNHLIQQASKTEIVQNQLADSSVNVFSGRTFADEEANPDRSDFDMASLMTIDEDAIGDAFKFDSSKMQFDTSSLNLAMPNLAFDPSAMPQMDLADMLGGMDLGGSTGELDMEAVLSDIDFEALAEGIDFSADQQAVAGLANRMAQGYLEFCMAEGLNPADTETNFPLFMQTPEGQAILAEAPGLLNGPGLQEYQRRLMAAVAQGIGEAVQGQLEASSAAMEQQIQAAMAGYMQQVMTSISEQISTQLGSALQSQIGGAMKSAMGQLSSNFSGAMGIDQDAFIEAFQFNMDEEDLTQLMMTLMGSEQSSFDGNLARLGYADLDKPSNINIYPIDFESKGKVIEILDEYNERMEAEGNDQKVITYTDIVGALMSSVTDIVNVISYVLVAFVSISLVVSSIMIGVITYISVLERKKEIGILRSIGASKRDIRRVFNAETLIVGFVAGVLGIGVTALLILPANAIIYSKFDISNVAQLPGIAAALLVVISMGLTFLAGLIPSSAASRKDPVEALRSE